MVLLRTARLLTFRAPVTAFEFTERVGSRVQAEHREPHKCAHIELTVNFSHPVKVTSGYSWIVEAVALRAVTERCSTHCITLCTCTS